MLHKPLLAPVILGCEDFTAITKQDLISCSLIIKMNVNTIIIRAFRY